MPWPAILLIASVQLLAAVLAFIKARIELQRARAEKGPAQTDPEAKGQRWMRASVVLAVLGLLTPLAPWAYRSLKPPKEIAITSPIDRVDVRSEGPSVWFPVRGTTSSPVVKDICAS